MAGEISTVIVKTDYRPVSAPHIGQRVRVKGRRGIFTILQVHSESRTVDLVSSGGIHAVEENISFSALRTLGEQVAQALELFLRCG